MRVVTDELLHQVRDKLVRAERPYALVGLLLMNTGMRLSEPIFAKRSDCVLDHEIPHFIVSQTELSNRKNKPSLRKIPLCGISLFAAQQLQMMATEEGSEWFVPRYAHFNGNGSCSAIINKFLKPFQFRSHMFRHSLIDRMKASNDIPVRLAESITGHSSGPSQFNHYGTVGYTLRQKLEVLRRISIE
jgi:integrase